MSDSSSLLTRERIIARAYGLCGLDSVSVEEGALGTEVLNDVIAQLDGQGTWLWTISPTEYSLSTISGQREYLVGTGSTEIPNYIQSLVPTPVVYRSVNSRTPIRIIGKDEALTTPELESSGGEPYLIYLEIAPNPSDQVIHLFPTPDSAYTIKFPYQRMLYDLDLATDKADVLRSMRLDLIKVLAGELTPYAGVALDQRQLLMASAEMARTAIKALNREKKDTVPTCAEYM